MFLHIQSGWTALHTAASTNSVNVVNVLLMEDSTLIKQTSKVNKLCFYKLPSNTSLHDFCSNKDYIEYGLDDPDNLGHLGHFLEGQVGLIHKLNYLDVTRISHIH